MNLLQKWFASIGHETCLGKHIYEAKITCNPIYSKIIKNKLSHPVHVAAMHDKPDFAIKMSKADFKMQSHFILQSMIS